jgi:hypothetical protein
MNIKEEQTFIHKGITIKLSSSGEFYANTDGGRIFAGSLASIKKKLDKLNVFKPFKAYTFYGYHDEEMREHEIVSIVKRRGHSGLEFVDKNGYHHSNVYADTPANRKLASQYMRDHKEFRKIEKAHEASQEALLKKMISLTPEATSE